DLMSVQVLVHARQHLLAPGDLLRRDPALFENEVEREVVRAVELRDELPRRRLPADSELPDHACERLLEILQQRLGGQARLVVPELREQRVPVDGVPHNVADLGALGAAVPLRPSRTIHLQEGASTRAVASRPSSWAAPPPRL